METTSILKSLLEVLFPKEIATNFEISGISESDESIEIKMEENVKLVPDNLKGTTEVVLDGFCNALELQSFPLRGKPVYIKLYRRRWKIKGTARHYSNQYNLHPEGVKATKEFASFLKESFGYTPDQYNDNLSGLMR
jgi:hypothetical protein